MLYLLNLLERGIYVLPNKSTYEVNNDVWGVQMFGDLSRKWVHYNQQFELMENPVFGKEEEDEWKDLMVASWWKFVAFYIYY